MLMFDFTILHCAFILHCSTGRPSCFVYNNRHVILIMLYCIVSGLLLSYLDLNFDCGKKVVRCVDGKLVGMDSLVMKHTN